MIRAPHLPLATALFALALGATAGAQPDSGKDSGVSSVIKDPAKARAAADAPARPTNNRPRRERVMSDELAATLAVGMPKYNPPKPAEKKATAVTTDAPKNGIVRLPEYIVRERRPTVFTERELATPDRKADLAFKIHPGLGIGPLTSLNRKVGLAMYQEQERLEAMNELADDARTMRSTGDKTTADYIMRQSQQTFIQRDDSWKAFGTGK